MKNICLVILAITVLVLTETCAISLEKIKDVKPTSESIMAKLPETKDPPSPPKVEAETLKPLLPGQVKPKEEEGSGDDGSILFEFEDEDGTVLTFDNGNKETPVENEEKDGTTTTEEPVGLSPSCLASLCG